MGQKIIRYYIASDLPFYTPVRITDAGYHETEAGKNSTQRVIDHYALHVIVKGKGVYSVNNESYSLHSGDCFLLVPGTPILYQSDKKEPWVYSWLGIDGSEVPSMMELCNLPANHPVAHYSPVQELTDCIHPLVIPEKKKPTTLSESYFALSRFFQLASHLIGKSQMNQSVSQKERYVQQAEAMIRDSYFREITVSGIAAEIGLDRTYLYRIFHEVTGTSIQKYITSLRMERACSLLESGTMSMAEIAKFCGYKSEQYFSIAFRKERGIAPSQYRCRNVNFPR